MAEIIYLPRELENKILEVWNRKRCFVIRGPRRSGKTTLLKHLQKSKGGTYLTLESPSLLDEFLRNPIMLVKGLEEPIYVDEIQYGGERIGNVLKLLYDETDKKIVVSGSGAFDVKTGLLGYMVGRTYIFDLLPLTFSEMVKWVKREFFHLYLEGNKNLLNILDGTNDKLPPKSPILEDVFKTYLLFGGYPEVVLGGLRNEIESIAVTSIEEDIIRYFSLKDHDRMWSFVKRLAVVPGQLVKLSSFDVSFRTAEEYLTILSRSFIIRLIGTYSHNKNVELSKVKKVYFYDNGFRNALIGSFTLIESDKGPLVENAIFRQLLKYGEIKYWRTRGGAEVDFILLRGTDAIPIEVKSGKGKISRSLLSFINRYHPKIAIVISSEPWSKSINGTIVYGIPAYYL